MPRKKINETPAASAAKSAPAAVPAKKPRTARTKSSASTRKSKPLSLETAATSAASMSKLAEAVANRPQIDYEKVAKLAYSHWLERGGQGGSAEDDWMRAEQELALMLEKTAK